MLRKWLVLIAQEYKDDFELRYVKISQNDNFLSNQHCLFKADSSVLIENECFVKYKAQIKLKCR